MRYFDFDWPNWRKRWFWFTSTDKLELFRVTLTFFHKHPDESFQIVDIEKRIKSPMIPSLYHTVARMVEEGFIKPSWGIKEQVHKYGTYEYNRVRVYKLTEKGRIKAEEIGTKTHIKKVL